jgi:hypothetical protein
VFRFITEYSSLRDFGPYVMDLFLYEDFWKMIFWVVLKLEISYHRVVISWRILVSFRGYCEDYIFAWWKSVAICWNRYSNFFVNSSYEIKEPSRPPTGVRCNFWHSHNNGCWHNNKVASLNTLITTTIQEKHEEEKIVSIHNITAEVLLCVHILLYVIRVCYKSNLHCA